MFLEKLIFGCIFFRTLNWKLGPTDRTELHSSSPLQNSSTEDTRGLWVSDKKDQSSGLNIWLTDHIKH